MALSPEQFNDFHQNLMANGGGTMNPRTGEYPDSGFMVSLPGHEEVMPQSKITASDIGDYANRKSKEFAPKNRFLGGWNSTTSRGAETFLDVSTRFPGEVAARRATMRRNQIANFDLSTFEETTNPFHPLSGSADPQFGGIGPDTPENREWWATSPKRGGGVKSRKPHKLPAPGPDFT